MTYDNTSARLKADQKQFIGRRQCRTLLKFLGERYDFGLQRSYKVDAAYGDAHPTKYRTLLVLRFVTPLVAGKLGKLWAALRVAILAFHHILIDLRPMVVASTA